ncbi:MAG: DUF58 domain-containing protein [Calditrichia bacterium]
MKRKKMSSNTKDWTRFLEPEALSGLKSLDIIARMIVEGFLVGLHKSPFHGFSAEFSEHRPYMPGDDLKKLDWKVYGKTGRYYIKQFEEETNVRAYLLLDISGSMGYASGKISKLEYAKYLTAALTYLLIQQRDAVGLTLFDEKIRQQLPPKSTPSYQRHILQQLARLEAGQNRTSVSQTLHLVAEQIKRRSMIILLSDFLYEEPAKILEGLRHFRHYQHELLVFNILDPQDRDFDFSDDVTFIDRETGERIKTQPQLLREEYRQKVREFFGTLQEECLRYRIDFQTIFTDEPFSRALLRYLLMRSRLK